MKFWICFLLFVIVCEGVILFGGHGIFGYGDFKSSQRQRVVQDLSMFCSALNVFKHTAGRFPTTEEGLDALVERPEGIDLEHYEPTLKHEILDPWQNPYRYEFPSSRGRAEPDITSAGPDMLFDTEDDIGNWEEGE